MKLLVILLIATETIGYYHNDVGIPAARRIKEAEETGLPRVSGGESTELGAYSFFAGLLIAARVNVTSVCGASLVSNTKLVTAAHCWYDGETHAILFEVVLASTTLFSGGTRVQTKDVVMHEDFDMKTIQNDIAVITIPTIEFNKYIMPINLPTERSFVGIACQVIGFGRTADKRPVTETQQLNHGFTIVISNEECSTMYGGLVRDSSICTSGLDGRGPCAGDSGGPVFYGVREFVLIGVVSFGAAAGCDVGYPTSHTRVSAYIQWIEERM